MLLAVSADNDDNDEINHYSFDGYYHNALSSEWLSVPAAAAGSLKTFCESWMHGRILHLYATAASPNIVPLHSPFCAFAHHISHIT